MKVALWYAAGVDEYGCAFSVKDQNEYYLLIDPELRLPVESVVDILDPETRANVLLVVKEWRYLPDYGLLILAVSVDESMEISPDKFVEYIRKNWTYSPEFVEATKD